MDNKKATNKLKKRKINKSGRKNPSSLPLNRSTFKFRDIARVSLLNNTTQPLDMFMYLYDKFRRK